MYNCCVALSEDEKKLILASPEFLEFVDTSSKFVERALNETYDFMKDYTLGIDVDRYRHEHEYIH